MYRFQFLFVAALSTGLSVHAAPTSETPQNNRYIDPMPAQSAGPLSGTGTIYLSDSNSYESATPFYAYDVERDEWASRASLPSSNTTQLASDSDGTVYCLPEDGVIYSYDDDSDTWRRAHDGPSASVGRNNISLFEVHDGTYVWGRDGTSELHYDTGEGWQLAQSPQALSSAASTDRETGLVYIRIYGTLGFMAFDPRTGEFPTTCDIGGSVGENGRFGAFANGQFFTREWAGTIQAIDGANCGRRDTGASSAGEHSSSAEDGQGRIYMNGFSNTGTVFEAFDVERNETTRLANCPDIPGNSHSTLVASVSSTPPGGLALFLSNLPETADRGSTVSFQADVINTGDETAFFDAATLHVSGPASTDISVYQGATVPVPSQGSRGANISIFVPRVAPTGEYDLELEILLGAESLVSDGFSVTVTD